MMPTNDRLRLNDGKHPKDRRKPVVELNENKPIEVREANSPAHLTPQHDHLMPQRDILCFKLAFRFEWRSQKGQKQP